MKPKFFSIFLMLFAISFSAFAQKAKPAKIISREIILDEGFTSLSIANDFSIVLTEGSGLKLLVVGDSRDIINLSARVSEGELVLSYSLPIQRPEIKVYVPASLLNRVTIDGRAVVTSAGVLKNEKLRILLAAEAKINVKSTGKLSMETINEIDFVKSL